MPEPSGGLFESTREPSLREFFRIAKLVPPDQTITSVHTGTSVRDVLALMDEFGFSQIPVVAGDSVIGTFTHRSLARGIGHLARDDDPLESMVEDFLEDLRFVRANEEISEVLGELDRDGAVLVGDESNLVAVATATDLIEFLWETTRPFVLIQDIELAVRDLMRAATSELELLDIISSTVGDRSRSGLTNDLDGLTMGEMLRVLLSEPNFEESFHRTFGTNRILVGSQLDPVREIRNKVFHFRDEITSNEINVLLAARQWLSRKVLMVKNQ